MTLREDLDAALREWETSLEHSDVNGRQGNPCAAVLEGQACCLASNHEQYEKMLDFLVTRMEEMRKSVIQAAVEDTDHTPDHPSPGETVLGCEHIPDPHGAHYYHVGEIGYRAPGGRIGVSSWLLICDDCFLKFGEDMTTALRSKSLRIGCDMPWPADMEVTFIRN
jgi:hypothetical protein